MKEITINEKDYQLAITPRGALAVEEKLGYNPINVLLSMKNNQLPRLKDLMVIFHQSLQKYHHGISYDEALGLFQDYCSEGGDLVHFIELIIRVFIDSGLIKEDIDPNM